MDEGPERTRAGTVGCPRESHITSAVCLWCPVAGA